MVAIFEVDGEGKLVLVRGDRYRDVGGGRAVLTPWIGRYRDYRDFSGIRIPSCVEVVWVLKDGEFSHARFRVITAEYNVEPPDS